MNVLEKNNRLSGCDIKVTGFSFPENWYKNIVGEIIEILPVDADTEEEYGDAYECTTGSYQDPDPYLVDGYIIEKQDCKIILNEKFLKNFITKKIAVNCETEEEAREFCNWMHDNGLKWTSKDDYRELNLWSNHKQNTCYVQCGPRSGSYSTFDLYESRNYTILKFSDCILPHNTNKKTHKILRPISIKSIMEAEPCNSNNEVEEFIKELFSRGNSYNHEIKTWEEFKSYNVLMRYKDWFLGKEGSHEAFIEEEKEKFEPFDLTFRIETEDELLEMYHRLNIGEFHVKKHLNENYFKFPYKWDPIKLFNVVDKEMHRIE